MTPLHQVSSSIPTRRFRPLNHRLSTKKETTSSLEGDNNDGESSHVPNSDDEDSFETRIPPQMKKARPKLSETHRRYADSEDGISSTLEDAGGKLS